MKKELLKKLQLGIISISALGLLAACGTDDTEDPLMEDEPAVEEPAEEDAEETDPVDGEVENDESETD